jgi:tRNA(fMet)-specific endonuclease VapC
MAIRYLLDTNTASYVIKGTKQSVRERLRDVPISQVAISVVTEAELRFGIVRKPEAVRLRILVEEFLLRVPSLAWDSESARQYAQLRTALEARGNILGSMDLMIAAQALAVHCVLVTNDRGFRHVKHLTTEDWTR